MSPRAAILRLAIVLAIGLLPARDALAAELRVEVAKGRFTVGDRVPAALVLTVPAAELRGTPVFPDWQAGWGELEVAEAGAVEVGTQGDPRVFRQPLVLVAFRAGDRPLPPVTVEVPLVGGVRRLTTSPQLSLAIASVLPPADAGEPEPQPARPPRSLPLGPRFWSAAAVLTGLCLALATALLRRRGDAAARSVRSGAATPLDQLLALLDGLRDEADADAFHTRLSLGLRSFLAQLLGFPAAESTTREIADALHRTLPGSHLAGEALELLQCCDAVKFARAPAAPEELRRRLATTRKLARDLAHPPGAGVPAEAA